MNFIEIDNRTITLSPSQVSTLRALAPRRTTTVVCGDVSITVSPGKARAKMNGRRCLVPGRELSIRRGFAAPDVVTLTESQWRNALGVPTAKKAESAKKEGEAA